MKCTTKKEIPLLEVLSELSPKSSKNTLRSWVKEGRVSVDGAFVKHSQLILEPGVEVEVGQRKKFIKSGIEIVYEDQDLVVINKPSGLLSVSTAFEKGETAHALLKQHYYPRRVYVVHRLDQDTSGVMVFALSEKANQSLKDLFMTHDIERYYTAIVEGKMTTSQGTWESFLYEDAQYRVHETEESEESEHAITHYQVTKILKRRTWLRLKLETGRKNQIRVHCQSAGHPIVGDKKYGAVTNPFKRLCLHADHLGFKHPISKKKLSFDSLPNFESPTAY